MVQKVWPEFKQEAHCYMGRDMTELSVNLTTNFTTDAILNSVLAPYGAMHRAVQLINEIAPIVMVDASELGQAASAPGTRVAANTTFKVFVEGEYPEGAAAMDRGYPGTATTLKEYLETAFDGVGLVTPSFVRGVDGTNTTGYNLNATVVTVTKVYKSQQI